MQRRIQRPINKFLKYIFKMNNFFNFLHNHYLIENKNTKKKKLPDREVSSFILDYILIEIFLTNESFDLLYLWLDSEI